MRLQTTVLFSLILAGLVLRLLYLTTSHPFFDEYTTVLAARQILRLGWPLLPSGLFYEHGLLATYLIAPFTALFINQPLAEWQAAQWGLMPARWPSLLVSVATIPLIFAAARRLLAPAGPQVAGAVGLLAAGLFALSPEGMVWGGRARMYALATFLVLLTVLWAYRGAVFPAPARYRWLALAALLAALLTQLGALMLVPPLVAAMLLLGWFTHRSANPPSSLLPSLSSARPWFWRWPVLAEGAALAAIIGVALGVKRLGQPLGAPALSEADGGLISELAGTVTYQTTFFFTWADTEKFLARQFGVPHHLWLALLAVAGLLLALVVYAWRRQKPLPLLPGSLFVGLIFGLLVVQMVTLLEPFRRNPRYIVLYLPLFYLLAAGAMVYILRQVEWLVRRRSTLAASPLTALALVSVLAAVGWRDVRVALGTPEPAYEQAFARIVAEWQPGDAVLTMNAPAAELYLGRLDGFTVQNDADQFLLNAETTPVDRWVGAPWVGSAAGFNTALNAQPRAWFVTDTIRQPVYYRGDWQAIVTSQLEQVWAGDNALLYRTAANRVPLPAEPATRLDANFAGAIQLLGVTLDNSPLTIVFFWQPLTPIDADYTVFLHLRNAAGQTVAQRDSQPLAGAYPTSQWQPGETVIDPLPLPLPPDLPAGQYRLVAGLYRLDTGERLPVANDSSGENAVVLGEVTLP